MILCFFKECFKKIIKFCCKRRKRCPPPICCNEKPECEQRRLLFAQASPVEALNAWQISFVNKLEGFPQDPNFCRNNFGDGSDVATIQNLNNPFVQKVLLDRLGSCSVVVWITDNGVPTLVKLTPGSAHPVRILPTPSLSCLAYRICINDGID